jgi:hypothetical protein
VKAFASFSMVLYLARVRREGEDKLWWIPFKKDFFGVKSFYNVLGCHDCVRFPLRSVCRTRYH